MPDSEISNYDMAFLREPLFRLSDWAAREESPRFAPGTIVVERFRIIRHIASGGMGDVYEAEDRELGRVALKTIRPEVARREGMAAAFRQEVQLARRVSSPHVCRIHELQLTPGRDGSSGPAFLTMQYVDGFTLSDYLAQAGRMKAGEAKQIVRQLCDGLSAIHAAGVVHTDLTSRNVMLERRDGQFHAVIMDFGLARERNAVESRGTDADSGLHPALFIGTPEYMAPEQFEGGEITPATDIYSLGVVLYEMVTGSRPFEASSVLGTASKRGRKPAAPSWIRPGLSHQWDDVIDHCLEYEPALRFETAEDVWKGLSSPVLSSAASSAGRSVADAIKRLPRAVVASAVAAAVMASLIIWSMLWPQTHTARPQTQQHTRAVAGK